MTNKKLKTNLILKVMKDVLIVVVMIHPQYALMNNSVYVCVNQAGNSRNLGVSVIKLLTKDKFNDIIL